MLGERKEAMRALTMMVVGWWVVLIPLEARSEGPRDSAAEDNTENAAQESPRYRLQLQGDHYEGVSRQGHHIFMVASYGEAQPVITPLAQLRGSTEEEGVALKEQNFQYFTLGVFYSHYISLHAGVSYFVGTGVEWNTIEVSPQANEMESVDVGYAYNIPSFRLGVQAPISTFHEMRLVAEYALKRMKRFSHPGLVGGRSNALIDAKNVEGVGFNADDIEVCLQWIFFIDYSWGLVTSVMWEWLRYSPPADAKKLSSALSFRFSQSSWRGGVGVMMRL